MATNHSKSKSRRRKAKKTHPPPEANVINEIVGHKLITIQDELFNLLSLYNFHQRSIHSLIETEYDMSHNRGQLLLALSLTAAKLERQSDAVMDDLDVVAKLVFARQ